MCKIRTSSIVTAFIILLLALLNSMPVYADDTSLGRTPEGVFPLEESDVIMESEEIVVDLEKNSVECLFVFHNTGKNKNVLMGFPGKLFDSEESEGTDSVNLELRNFKTFVNGDEIHVAHEKSIQNNNTDPTNELKYSEYFTFTVPFKADGKVIVRNNYDFTPSFDSMGDTFSGYVLKTGALWKETIGSAKVIFKLGKIKPYEIEQLKPGGYKFVGDNLVWERKDFEPGYDLNLIYNKWRYSEDFLNNYATNFGYSKDEINMKMESYNKVTELANKGDTNELAGMHQKALENKDYVLAIYIESFLPEHKLSDKKSTLGDIEVENRNGHYLVSCDIEGIDTPIVQVKISHSENGNEILDAQFESPTCFVKFTPGIVYDITYTLCDWMDRTEQKTLKYSVPDQAEVTSGNQTQPFASFETLPVTADSNIEPEPANETSAASANESTSKPIISSKSNILSPIVWIAAGVILVGFSVIFYVKSKISRFKS